MGGGEGGEVGGGMGGARCLRAPIATEKAALVVGVCSTSGAASEPDQIDSVWFGLVRRLCVLALCADSGCWLALGFGWALCACPCSYHSCFYVSSSPADMRAIEGEWMMPSHWRQGLDWDWGVAYSRVLCCFLPPPPPPPRLCSNNS